MRSTFEPSCHGRTSSDWASDARSANEGRQTLIQRLTRSWKACSLAFTSERSLKATTARSLDFHRLRIVGR
jgi:hypothetical protein